jgi:hypothetical protein
VKSVHNKSYYRRAGVFLFGGRHFFGASGAPHARYAAPTCGARAGSLLQFATRARHEDISFEASCNGAREIDRGSWALVPSPIAGCCALSLSLSLCVCVCVCVCAPLPWHINPARTALHPQATGDHCRQPPTAPCIYDACEKFAQFACFTASAKSHVRTPIARAAAGGLCRRSAQKCCFAV